MKPALDHFSDVTPCVIACPQMTQLGFGLVANVFLPLKPVENVLPFEAFKLLRISVGEAELSRSADHRAGNIRY